MVTASALPRHVAVVMDGNGRWANERGLPRTKGHEAGEAALLDVVAGAIEAGVTHLSAYAFSTENWKRSQDEVAAIMGLFGKYLREAIGEMEQDKIRLRIFGDLSRISPDLRALIHTTDEISARYEGFQANLCVNYGGRDEIVRAARTFAEQCARGEKKPEELTENLFSGLLDTAGVPDPDLIIRPSGEIRVSNFLLWQSAYAEYYFTDVLWPDFDEKELERAIAAYNGRSRRFGGV